MIEQGKENVERHPLEQLNDDINELNSNIADLAQRVLNLRLPISPEALKAIAELQKLKPTDK